MIRTVGAAALLALAAIMPQPAAAQNPLGGAIIGGAIGAGVGAAVGGGRAGGIIAGSVIGGTIGATIGAQAEPRYGGRYRWYEGHCYRAVQGGWMVVNPRRCY